VLFFVAPRLAVFVAVPRFAVAFLAVLRFVPLAFVARRAVAVFFLVDPFLLATLRALLATVETAPPTAVPTLTAKSLAPSKPAPAVSNAELRIPSFSVSIVASIA
jgi:hypothetical protein